MQRSRLITTANSYFAEVVLPLPLKQSFTYALPTKYRDQKVIGARVVVPFRQQLLIGIVSATHQQAPNYAVKPVLAVLDMKPWLTKQQFRFLTWLSSYYMHPLRHMFQAVFDNHLSHWKPQIVLLPDCIHCTNLEKLPGTEALLTALSQSPKCNWTQAKKIVAPHDPMAVVQQLIHENVIKLTDRGLPTLPLRNHIALHTTYQSEKALATLKATLAKRKAQLKAVEGYLALKTPKSHFRWIPVADLAAKGILRSTINTLVKKAIFSLAKRASDPSCVKNKHSRTPIVLTAPQKDYHKKIVTLWQTKKVVIAVGKAITDEPTWGLSLFLQPLLPNEQALCLLPAKPTDTQWLKLLRQQGAEVVFYDSALSPQKKRMIWEQVANNQVKWVIGTRKSLFLPFQKVARIIVMQEQDERYGSRRDLPYFHARDAAIMLAHQHRAHTLLTAPIASLSSYYNVKIGKYGMVELPGQSIAPKQFRITVHEQKKGFSNLLASSIRKKMHAVLEAKRSIILLHHRQGYALYNVCPRCRWIAKCPACGKYLIFHQKTNLLTCHYCPYTTAPYSACPSCYTTQLQQKGVGLEQWVELLTTYFPKKKVISLDRGITPKTWQQTKDGLQQGKLHIIVASPALIRYLPTNNKALIIIPDIEGWLRLPHFKAEERCYRYLLHLASKGHLPTHDEIWIQTRYRTAHLYHMINNIVNQRSTLQCEYLLKERTTYGYPPYKKQINICLQDTDPKRLHTTSIALAEALSHAFSRPIIPLMPAVRPYPKALSTTFLIFTFDRSTAMVTKRQLYSIIATLQEQKPFCKVTITFEVDPL